MTGNELFKTLSLLKVEGVGDIMAKKLINHCGSAEAVLSATRKQLLAIDGVGEVAFKNLQDKEVFKAAEAEMEFIDKEGITPLFYKEEDYPEKLKHCIDAPVLLFSSGNINLQDRKIISIVGTRQITSYGTDFCRKLI